MNRNKITYWPWKCKRQSSIWNSMTSQVTALLVLICTWNHREEQTANTTLTTIWFWIQVASKFLLSLSLVWEKLFHEDYSASIILTMKSSVFQIRSLRFTNFDEISLCPNFFWYLIKKVTTCRLLGWCMLGVFLLLASTPLGYQHEDLLSPCNGMHACTD